MCIDYTDLNKAFPKDAYLLPSIDRLVDRAPSHALLKFLDAYSSYNQIMMYLPDEENTTFIIDQANFYYRVMLFGLKNARATYQRLMDKIFHQQIGRNMEVYVDDMVVKTTSVEAHTADLAEVFNQI
uniref:Transposon Ty3-I Gag-Pol polyprotein n=1 Tax=Cajanus cajan TaxID=3821 RepID=A0A151SCS2_CAJCA|nr:Transposon Ty3-I Gag-Pol polyprotein [Cajanus cajan]